VAKNALRARSRLGFELLRPRIEGGPGGRYVLLERLNDGAEMARVLGIFRLTFIASFVVRRAVPTMRRCFRASLYPQVSVLLRILARERARWLPQPLFLVLRSGRRLGHEAVGRSAKTEIAERGYCSRCPYKT
jgi:hypothetical protein